MLVIISDLHLTDGTTGKTVAADAIRQFRESLRDLAYDASWRSDGSYKPIESLDLILLGDIFDLIRSTKWSDDQPGDPDFVRPWDDPQQNPAFARKVGQIADAIMQKNADAFELLRQIGQDNWLTVPPATDSGHPATAAVERQPVNARIHYMIGNHDWFLHLPGAEFESIRQKITAALGLANPPGPYPHDPAESNLLADIYQQHNFFGRHGDIYDPFNYNKEKGRDAATLGDAIVVELINRFPQQVRLRMENELPATFLNDLHELANVRPSLLVPVWINSLINRSGLSTALGNEVKRVWNEIADQTMALPFIREQDTHSPFDTVDLLETTLHFSKILSFHSIAEFVTWVQKKLWGGDSSFAKFVFEEDAFKTRSAQYFVYGHTHHYEIVPLDAIMLGGKIFEQMYFNSGTWHPLHGATIYNPRGQSFVQYKVLTYLAFFAEGERKGRRYETWTGTLDD